MIYSKKYTVAKSTLKSFDLEVEGEIVTQVRIRFPPGCHALVKVAIDYGIKRIFPYEEDTWFYGDDEVIEWIESWEMPESPCILKIVVDNTDDTYEHSIYVVIVTRKKDETLASVIADKVINSIKRLFGWI